VTAEDILVDQKNRNEDIRKTLSIIIKNIAIIYGKDA
jgi:hypothetical protein